MKGTDLVVTCDRKQVGTISLVGEQLSFIYAPSWVFGLILLSTPAAFGVGLSMVFGVWSLVAGVVLIVNSFRIRAGKKQLVAFGAQTA